MLIDKPPGVGRDVLVADYRLGRRKGSDDVRIAALHIPKVMKIAIGEDDEAAILRLRIFAGLFFADQRIFIFGLGFENDERKASVVEQEEVDETLAGFFEIGPKRI